MISVCLATYNGEKYIREQIDSILPQLNNGDELIISDDGSTDKTLNIIETYLDHRIIVFQNNNRKGVIGNFENALLNAKGNYIFLCDQDDLWMPGRVEIMVKELNKFDLVVCDAEVIDENQNIIQKSFFEFRKSGKGYLKNLFINSYLGCCMAFRRDVLTYALPIPPNVAMHDIWIGLCVELRGRVKFLPLILTKYRRHGNNASPTAQKSDLSKIEQIRYRIDFLVETFKRKFSRH